MLIKLDTGLRRLAVACLAGIMSLALLGGIAEAAGSSKIKWTMGTTASAGTPDPFSYRLSLPHGDSATLDEQRGKHGWKPVVTLDPNPAGRGSGTAPALKQGTYFFSIAINNGKGKPVASSSTIEVKVGPAPPKVSWTLQGTANENTAIPYSWTVSGLAKGESIVIQQPEGTKRVWTTITTLSGTNGSGTLPGLGIGPSYTYRLAAIDRAGNVLAVDPASVSVYGQVPFSTLLNTGGYDSGTYAGPANTFDYTYANSPNVGSGTFSGTVFTVNAAQNDCTSVHADFLLGDTASSEWSTDASDTMTLTVVQQSQNAVAATAAFDTAGSVDANLIPGQSWSISISGQTTSGFTPGDGGREETLVDGYAVCDSTKQIGNDN